VSAAQPTHVFVAGLQTGVTPPQFALVKQAAHVPVAVLQTGFAPVQAVALVAEHCPHEPDASQAGVAPLQFASVVQPTQTWVVVLHTGVAPLQFAPVRQPTQVFVAVLHTGVAPLQFAFVVQATQVLVVVLQAGVAPVHLVAFVDEQSPHAPEASQAGSAAGQLASFTQGPQTCVVVLHTGALVPQFKFVRHTTQIFGDTAVSHTGFAAGHCELVTH